MLCRIRSLLCDSFSLWYILLPACFSPFLFIFCLSFFPCAAVNDLLLLFFFALLFFRDSTAALYCSVHGAFAPIRKLFIASVLRFIHCICLSTHYHFQCNWKLDFCFSLSQRSAVRERKKVFSLVGCLSCGRMMQWRFAKIKTSRIHTSTRQWW